MSATTTPTTFSDLSSFFVQFTKLAVNEIPSSWNSFIHGRQSEQRVCLTPLNNQMWSDNKKKIMDIFYSSYFPHPRHFSIPRLNMWIDRAQTGNMLQLFQISQMRHSNDDAISICPSTSSRRAHFYASNPSFRVYRGGQPQNLAFSQPVHVNSIRYVIGVVK